MSTEGATPDEYAILSPFEFDALEQDVELLQ